MEETLMNNGTSAFDRPGNEPVLSHAPGSKERGELEKALQELRSREYEIMPVIGGKRVKTGRIAECREPHDLSHRLATWHKGGSAEAAQAIDAALEAQPMWAAMDFDDRAAIFNRAAALLAGPRRAEANAATMLGQSKNAFQAEIDSACELADFFRFNNYFAARIYAEQPFSPPGQLNQLEYRPLEGFVFAVTPFNFTSIAGNLPAAPALMGNTVVWKPASTGVYPAHFLMELLEEAGMPPGVINLLPGSGAEIGGEIMAHPGLAGVHFTGSTGVFRQIWRTIAENIDTYRGYPRIVGETGGKDFVVVHESADVAQVVTALLRGAFEYQGQKCSAASRCYLPSNLWGEISERLVAEIAELKMGSPVDFTNFVNAVIDRASFESIEGYIKFASESSDASVITGGGCDSSQGYFIEPTLIKVEKPDFKTMVEEIFGPVLSVFVYDENDYEGVLRTCDTTSPYALTGAVFARDRRAIARTREVLVNAAGNFYINDKPTGAVVGQQPFGGARASGTNDKAGSHLNLLRWTSARTVKETFVPPSDWRYPFMG
jgi:1-pyrroline-5-carboxylate dehydrogenase